LILKENKKGDFEMAKASKVSVSSPSVRMIVALDKINFDLSRNRLAGMSEDSISQLADNIKIHGVLQNIILNDKGDGTFEVMGGIRRTMAARMAGLKDIPALVYKNLSKEDHFIIQMDENGKRENPSFIDRAKDMLRAKEEFNWTQTKVAKVFGYSDAEVSKFLKLLTLDVNIQKAIHDGEYTLVDAFRLLTTKDGEPVNPEAMALVGDATAIISNTNKSKEEKKKLNSKVLDAIDKKFADKGINSGIAPSATTKAENKVAAKIEAQKKDLPPINLSGAAMPPKVDPKTPSSISPPSRQPLPPLNQPTVSVTAEKRQKGLSREEIDGLLLFLEKQCSGEARKFISDFAGHIEGAKNCASRHELGMILKSLEKVNQEAK
jgi:ParB/RepB/Spo0J family partition protein